MGYLRPDQGEARENLADTAGGTFTGSVTIAGPRPWIDVRSYGAVGNGVADDTAAIQAAVNAAISASGDEGSMVVVPTGTYKLTATVTMLSGNGLVIQGAGGSDTYPNTQFTWGGNTTTPMFKMQDCGRCVMRDLTLFANDSTPLLVGIQLENHTGGTITPKENIFERVTITADVAGSILKAGWYHAQGSGGDANNDFSTFIKCTVSNYDNCGWLFMHSQSKGHGFLDCSARGIEGTSQIGVSAGNDTHAAATANGGSFRWQGGAMASNGLADFYSQTPNDPLLILNCNSENSACFLIQAGVTSVRSPITLMGNRYNPQAQLNASDYWVQVSSPGPLLVIGNRFEDGDPDTAGKLLIAPGGTVVGHVLLQGNYFEGSVDNIDNLVVKGGTANADVVALGNTGGTFGGTVANFQDRPFAARGANGQSLQIKMLEEETTIAAAATTDTTIQMPAGAIILAVPVRVTTAIPTAANFTVGDSGSAARFNTGASVAVAANTTDKGTKAGAYYNASALSVRITPNLTPAANTGRVRVSIYYVEAIAPTA